MLFLRIIIGIQISNILVSFNKLKELIFERYKKVSLRNECAQVISTNSRFCCSRRAFHLRSRKRYNSENITYKIHLQSSKMTDPLKGQMPLYFQSVENKLHERKQKSVGNVP